MRSYIEHTSFVSNKTDLHRDVEKLVDICESLVDENKDLREMIDKHTKVLNLMNKREKLTITQVEVLKRYIDIHREYIKDIWNWLILRRVVNSIHMMILNIKSALLKFLISLL